MKKVSVIIPVYNSQKYLDDCLFSIANQTIDNLEIIIIDDCSTDNSRLIIEKYVSNYSCIIPIYNNKNMGQSKCRNIGILHSSGQYIGFVDSDDFINPYMYENLYEGACKYNMPDIISSGITFVKEECKPENEYYQNSKLCKLYVPSIDKNIIYSLSPSCCNKLFKRETILKGFIDVPIWEDMAFTYSKIINAKSILCFNNIDYYYRKQSNTGVSSQGFKLNDNLLCIFKIADYLKDSTTSNIYKNLNYEIRSLQIILCLQRIIEISDWKIDEREKKEIISNMFKIIYIRYGDWHDLDIEIISTHVDVIKIEFLEKSSEIKEFKIKIKRLYSL